MDRFLGASSKDRVSKRVSAIVVPVRGGKSKLQQDLKSYEGKQVVRFIDLDAFADEKVPEVKEAQRGASWELTVYPKLKKSIMDSVAQFKDDLFVLITSSPDCVKYIGIPTKRANVYIPASEYNETILKQNTDIDLQALIRKSRDELMTKYKGGFTPYRSQAELVDIVSAKYGLTLKF